jgi:hypothetical protein
VTTTARATWVALVVALTLALGLAGQPGNAAAELGLPRQVSWAAGEPTVLSLRSDWPRVGYGESAVLSGRLTDPVTGSGLAGAAVQLESLDPAGAWVEMATLTTDASGATASAVTPLAATTYRLRYADPGAPEASVSPSVTVAVHAALAAAVSRTTVRAGRALVVTGTLAPADGPVRLERLTAGRWVLARLVQPAADGSFAATVTPAAPGWWRWRLARPDTADRPGATVRLPRVNAVRMHTYSVATRGRVRADRALFTAAVAATYADPRGWLRGHHGFRQVPRHGDFTVVLAQASALPRFSWVCSSSYSCQVGRYVIINRDRWRRGSPHFPGDLLTYRQMLVDHETGHWLGRGHAYCPRPGALAPVMQQQTKGMQGCRPNAWPLTREIRAVS